MKRLAFYMLAVLVMTAMPAAAADMSIMVPNVESDKGVVRTFICSSDEFLGDTCAYKKAAPAKTGPMKFLIKNVPIGTYAIEIYHDENENGKIDFGFLGVLPAEAYGFSRLGAIYSEPQFTEAAFEVEGQQMAFTIPLHYP
ncbi:MAG: DUF2141 domain-containing protein [Alphaproteobacteria bacterium]